MVTLGNKGARWFLRWFASWRCPFLRTSPGSPAPCHWPRRLKCTSSSWWVTPTTPQNRLHEDWSGSDHYTLTLPTPFCPLVLDYNPHICTYMELPQLWQPLPETLMTSWHINFAFVAHRAAAITSCAAEFCTCVFFSPQLEVSDLSICVITLHPVENVCLLSH